MNLNTKTLDHIFTYHPPTGEQQARYQGLTQDARTLAFTILMVCPDSREKSLALTKLQEVRMWANAAIAVNEAALPEPDPRDVPQERPTDQASAEPLG